MEQRRVESYILNAFFVAFLCASFQFVMRECLQLPTLHSIVVTVDEVYIALLTVFTILYKKKVRQFQFLLLLLGFTVTGSLGGYVNGSSATVTILGGFNTVRPLLLYWCFCQYDFTKEQLLSFLRRFNIIFYLSLAGFVLDILYPDFRSMLNMVTQHENDVRLFGLRPIGGIYNRFTYASFFGLLFYVNYKYYLGGGRFKQAMSALMILLTLKVKDMFGFLVVLFSSLFKRIGLSIFLLSGLFIIGLFVSYITLMPEHYEKYFNAENDNIARIVLMKTSVQIVQDKFPLGEGFGRFASPISIHHTFSQSYANYGIDNVYGINPEMGASFAYDGFWQMLLGETGFLGTLLYVWMMMIVFKEPIAGYLKDTTDRRYIYPVFLFIFSFFGAFGKSTFTGPPHSLMLWAMAGLFYSLNRQGIQWTNTVGEKGDEPSEERESEEKSEGLRVRTESLETH